MAGTKKVAVTFWGAAGTVTGSKYLVEYTSLNGKTQRILVDAGMFQGSREWTEKNWDNFSVDPRTINAVLLTHAHIDHTGILPRLYKMGLRCPVYATPPTIEIVKLLLPDAAGLQEEEAFYRAKEGRSRFKPPLPLYTIEDAQGALRLLKPAAWYKDLEVLPGIFARWSRMGHILGAASINLSLGGKRITFSGDIGRYQIPILHDPEPVELGDLLLIESTYGDKLHHEEDPAEALAEVVNESLRGDGVILIPSFAVGRAQSLLYYLRELESSRRIPSVPIYVDSPMACDATDIYARFPQDFDEAALGLHKRGVAPFSPEQLHFSRSRDESKRINSVDGPLIIISASGMLSGGRILHHLRQRISSPKTTVLLVGYQPPGGRGDLLKRGAPSIRVFGDEIPVRAKVAEISGLSAHADGEELLRWCATCRGRPGNVAVVHGEPATAQSFAETLRTKFQWSAHAANYMQTIDV